MSSYSFATTLTEDGKKIDAYAAEFANTFQQILQAVDPHLAGLKQPLKNMLEPYGLLGNDTAIDAVGVATLIRTLNQQDWEAEYQGRHPYPDSDVIETMPLALNQAKGFDIHSFEGLLHFQDALQRLQYNIGAASLWGPSNSPLASLTAAAGVAATAKHPTLLKRDERPSPSEVAHSITKLMAHSNSLYFASGLNLWETFDTFDLQMHFAGSPGNKHQSVSGEDRLMYLYQHAFYEANELVVPLPGSFEGQPFAPYAFMPVNQYYAHNYKSSSEIPRPELADLENLQLALEISLAQFDAPDRVFYDPDGQVITPGSAFSTKLSTMKNDLQHFRDSHLRAIHDNLNPVKLNPLMPYEAAMADFKAEHTPNTSVIVVHDEPCTDKYSADSLGDFCRSGGLVFTNADDADLYIAHIERTKRQSPVRDEFLCSPAQLRRVPLVALWQIEAIRHSLNNIEPNTMAMMSTQQRMSIVRDIAADQGLHLPEPFLKAVQQELSTYAHMDNWTNQLRSALNRVPKDEIPAVLSEFARNAPSPSEEAPKMDSEPFTGYSRPRLSPH